MGPSASGKTTYIGNSLARHHDSAVLDGTYTMSSDRKTAITRMKEANPDLKIHGVIMMTPATECIERSKKRYDANPGKEPNAPERAIKGMHDSLHGLDVRNPLPSFKKEGFATVTYCFKTFDKNLPDIIIESPSESD